MDDIREYFLNLKIYKQQEKNSFIIQIDYRIILF